MSGNHTLFEMSRADIDTVDPYCFVSGDTPVRMRFAQQGRTLPELLIEYFSQLKRA